MCTNQHTTLLDGTPADTDLADSRSLGITSHGDRVAFWVAKAIPILMEALKAKRSSVVVVQGDTMSALAGAVAGGRLGLPVVHVEAGLRSHDLKNPEPEEGIRHAITGIASLHLAPTELARTNLMAGGIDPKTIVITGNTGISAIERYAPQDPDDQVRLEARRAHEAVWGSKEIPILLTMHRREWLALGPEHVQATVKRACEIDNTSHGPLIWPMHPHVKQLVGEGIATGSKSGGQGQLMIRDPMPYRETINLLRWCRGIATDSGGLQEEAAYLGIPCAVLRTVSDRPESVRLGLAKLFEPSPIGLSEAITWLRERSDYHGLSLCYGTPESAKHVAEAIVSRYP